MDSKSIARKGVPVRLRDPVLNPDETWFRRGFFVGASVGGGVWEERRSVRDAERVGERVRIAEGWNCGGGEGGKRLTTETVAAVLAVAAVLTIAAIVTR